MLCTGIDFGTSNSLVAIAENEEKIQPVELEYNDVVVPTALFFGQEKLYGKSAINAYLAGMPGRFMRGMKSLLGSKTETDGTYIDGHFVSFAELVKTFLHFLKFKSDKKADQNLENVVVGRPVHFDSDPEEDKAAQDTLERICHQIGFKNVGFQYEPIAAALHYEHTIKSEELTFVADLGGGTSDFSVIRLSPQAHKKGDRSSDILANDSVHVAGTDLDKNISYDIVMPYFGKNGRSYNKDG